MPVISAVQLSGIVASGKNINYFAWSRDDSFVYYVKGTVCMEGCAPGFLYRVHPTAGARNEWWTCGSGWSTASSRDSMLYYECTTFSNMLK